MSTKICDYVRSGIESRCVRLPSPMSTRRSHEMAGGAFSTRTPPFRRKEDPGSLRSVKVFGKRIALVKFLLINETFV
jgi:hypothetical protein